MYCIILYYIILYYIILYIRPAWGRRVARAALRLHSNHLYARAIYTLLHCYIHISYNIELYCIILFSAPAPPLKPVRTCNIYYIILYTVLYMPRWRPSWWLCACVRARAFACVCVCLCVTVTSGRTVLMARAMPAMRPAPPTGTTTTSTLGTWDNNIYIIYIKTQ